MLEVATAITKEAELIPTPRRPNGGLYCR